MSRLMTPDETADYLRVSVKTLYSWRLAGGGPPAFRVGKYLRYDESAVRRWVEGETAADRQARVTERRSPAPPDAGLPTTDPSPKR